MSAKSASSPTNPHIFYWNFVESRPAERLAVNNRDIWQHWGPKTPRGPPEFSSLEANRQESASVRFHGDFGLVLNQSDVAAWKKAKNVEAIDG